jgi:hypothetical protein
MIALDGALRRLTVCQLTRDRAEMAVAFGRGCGFASGRLLGGQLDPGWNLTIGRRRPVSPCLGAHEAHPKNYFVWGCFPKIEWAPAYVDPGGPFALLQEGWEGVCNTTTSAFIRRPRSKCRETPEGEPLLGFPCIRLPAPSGAPRGLGSTKGAL